jgi:hypothetical protein
MKLGVYWGKVGLGVVIRCLLDNKHVKVRCEEICDLGCENREFTKS